MQQANAAPVATYTGNAVPYAGTGAQGSNIYSAMAAGTSPLFYTGSNPTQNAYNPNQYAGNATGPNVGGGMQRTPVQADTGPVDLFSYDPYRDEYSAWDNLQKAKAFVSSDNATWQDRSDFFQRYGDSPTVTAFRDQQGNLQYEVVRGETAYDEWGRAFTRYTRVTPDGQGKFKKQALNKQGYLGGYRTQWNGKAITGPTGSGGTQDLGWWEQSGEYGGAVNQ